MLKKCAIYIGINQLYESWTKSKSTLETSWLPPATSSWWTFMHPLNIFSKLWLFLILWTIWIERDVIIFTNTTWPDQDEMLRTILQGLLHGSSSLQRLFRLRCWNLWRRPSLWENLIHNLRIAYNLLYRWSSSQFFWKIKLPNGPLVCVMRRCLVTILNVLGFMLNLLLVLFSFFFELILSLFFQIFR